MTRLKNISKSNSGNSVICIIMMLRKLGLFCVKHIIVVKVCSSASVDMFLNVRSMQLRLVHFKK